MDHIAAARKILEDTYAGVCTISSKTKQKVNGETKLVDSILVENQPCSISQEALKTVKQSEGPANILYNAKIFMAPEINVPAGSKITAIQYGQTYNLESSGKPFVYDTHQEILALEKDYA